MRLSGGGGKIEERGLSIRNFVMPLIANIRYDLQTETRGFMRYSVMESLLLFHSEPKLVFFYHLAGTIYEALMEKASKAC